MNTEANSQPARTYQRLGAIPLAGDQTLFRVWAPRRQNVAVEFLRGEATIRQPLSPTRDGYFEATLDQAAVNTRYRYLLDDQLARPDPVSMFQPEGVHGPSQVIDHQTFPWTDQGWRGITKRELVIYELHIGAFTQAGSFAAAIGRLPELVRLGVTAVELMPVAQSPGRWNWGYDGVNLYAVRNTYGRPDDFKAFVDACHAEGLAVILDVVYNHVGPEGNYLADFGPYFSQRHHSPWGESFNFDEPGAEQVRPYVVDNALFWLDVYHLDGLRLDAAHFILDDSPITVLDEMAGAVSAMAQSTGRHMHLIAETNVFDQDLLSSRDGRPAFDAIWCDCLMHSIYSLGVPELRLTRRTYHGAGDLAESLQFGYLYEGPQQLRQAAGRIVANRQDDGEPVEKREYFESLVIALQTHDAVGNHPLGKRIHQLTSKSFQRAAATLVLLYPGIPLMFMGEEQAVEAPFPFFVDFEDPRLRQAVDQARAREFPQHIWGATLLPSKTATYENAKFDSAGDGDREMFAWYRDLITLRKQGIAAGWLAAERMSARHDPDHDLFALRFEGGESGVLTVQVRLAAAARPAVVRVPAEGAVLMSSEPELRVESESVWLQRNHAVISRTAGVRGQ